MKFYLQAEPNTRFLCVYSHKYPPNSMTSVYLCVNDKLRPLLITVNQTHTHTVCRRWWWMSAVAPPSGQACSKSVLSGCKQPAGGANSSSRVQSGVIIHLFKI